MDNFEILTKKYESWLKHQNVKFSVDATIKDLRSEKEGRGVVALQDIKEDDILFEIPRTLILNIETSTLLEERPELQDDLVRLNQWEALIIVLLYEIKVKGTDSLWYNYFQVLPIVDKENYQFNQLMFWSAEELKELEPSLIVQRIGKELADGMYNKLFPYIVIDKMGIKELEDTTLVEYHEIASLIMSYSFDIEKLNSRGFVDGEDGEDDSGEDGEDDGEEEEEEEEEEEKEEGEEEGEGEGEIEGEAKEKEGQEETSPNATLSEDEFPDSVKRDPFLKALIPLADTLNADTNLHNASLEYKGDKLIIRAIKPIKKGDQIYNTYSDHPNSEILRRYGYVEIFGSKHDFGEVPFSTIKTFFSKELGSTFFDEIIDIFNRIIAEQDPENEVVEIVLDSYDCFASGQVIVELITLIQCLTILSSINSINSMESLKFDSKYQLIRRIYRKCIQLIESQSLTEQFLINYKSVIQTRLDEYPKFAADEFTDDFKYNRHAMAKIVLQSEYRSLQNCLDNDNTFMVEDTKYKFIDDQKLVRNIIKRKFDLPIEKAKKQKLQ